MNGESWAFGSGRRPWALSILCRAAGPDRQTRMKSRPAILLFGAFSRRQVNAISDNSGRTVATAREWRFPEHTIRFAPLNRRILPNRCNAIARRSPPSRPIRRGNPAHTGRSNNQATEHPTKRNQMVHWIHERDFAQGRRPCRETIIFEHFLGSKLRLPNTHESKDSVMLLILSASASGDVKSSQSFRLRRGGLGRVFH